MAAEKFNEAVMKTASKATSWKIDPFDLVVKEELRGRRAPPTDEQIVAMAVSMHQTGQLQPVVVRRMTVGEQKLAPVVMIGFTRTDAAKLIRNGFEYTCEEDGKEVKKSIRDEKFMLDVVVRDVNDEQALINNIQENAMRNACSPMDDAENQEKLRSKYNYTDSRIAQIYNYNSQVKVSRLKKLLLLPEVAKNLVHDLKLSVDGALQLLDLPENEQQESIQELTKEDGSINGAELKSLVREKILAKLEASTPAEEGAAPVAEGTAAPAAETPAAAAPTKRALSLKEWRLDWESFLEVDKDNNHKFDAHIVKFARKMLQRVNGQIQQKTFHKAVEALLDAVRCEEEEAVEEVAA